MKKPLKNQSHREIGEKLETGDHNLEIGDWKLENGVWNLEIGDQKPENGEQNLEIGYWKAGPGLGGVSIRSRSPRRPGGHRGPNISAPGPKAPEAC